MSFRNWVRKEFRMNCGAVLIGFLRLLSFLAKREILMAYLSFYALHNPAVEHTTAFQISNSIRLISMIYSISSL